MDDCIAQVDTFAILDTAIDRTLSACGMMDQVDDTVRDMVHAVHARGVDGAVGSVMALAKFGVDKCVDIASLLKRVGDACPPIGGAGSVGTVELLNLVSEVLRDIVPVHGDFLMQVSDEFGSAVVDRIVGEHIARRACLSHSPEVRGIASTILIRVNVETVANALVVNHALFGFSHPKVPVHWLSFPGTDKPEDSLDIGKAISDMRSHDCMPKLGDFTYTHGYTEVPFSVVVAGGCPSTALNTPGKSPNSHGDIDVYVVCDYNDKRVRIDVLMGVVKSFEKGLSESWTVDTVVMTKQAVTFNLFFEHGVRRKQVQFSMRVYPSVAGILLSYDLSCACVAYDGTSFLMTPTALWSHVVNPLIASTMTRVCLKYPSRGFQVTVPVREERALQMHSLTIDQLDSMNTGKWNLDSLVSWKATRFTLDATKEGDWGSDVATVVYSHYHLPGSCIHSNKNIRVFKGDSIGSWSMHTHIKRSDVLVGKDAIVRSVSWLMSASAFYSDDDASV
jgi:hypothetical protein